MNKDGLTITVRIADMEEFKALVAAAVEVCTCALPWELEEHVELLRQRLEEFTNDDDASEGWKRWATRAQR